MLLGAAGVPQDLALSRDYDAIFSQLQASGISVYTPNCQYQENPGALSLGLESDFLPPPFGTADPSVYEAMRAHGIKLVINADQLYDPNEPMPSLENDPLQALINAAGRDLIYAINGYDEPAAHNISVAASQALYEHIKSVDSTIQVLQIHASFDETNPAFLTPEGVAAYLAQVAAHGQWADMVGFDVYPIGLTRGCLSPYSNGAIVSPAQAVHDYLTWLQTELPSTQHAMVLQAFSVLDVYSQEMLATLDPQTLAALTAPTADELASMLNAAGGADAVFWWGQSHIANSALSDLWQDVLHQTNLFSSTFSVMDILGTAAAEVLAGTDVAERIDGAGGNDELLGAGGNDTLVGGTGADMMRGGQGSDTYYIDDAGDVADEVGGNGADVVRTNLASFSLASANVRGDVENLVGTSGSGQTLTGNALANTIVGSWGNDTISGGGGADTLRGGLGNDVYVVNGAGVTVDEVGVSGTDTVRTSMAQFDLSMAGILGDIENLTGSLASGQILTGNALDNLITGGAGNDTLVGGGGSDTLRGGAGNDTYLITAMELADETGGSGTDTVRTALSGFDLAGPNVQGLIENLTGISNSGQFLTGNSLNNVITAGAGDDTLDGGAGLDTLYGGLGDDLYLVGQTGDVIVELGTAGLDTVISSATYTLSANVEHLLLTGNSSINGTGNSGANEIQGNGAANVIDGGAGADFMAGGAGADTYFVDNVGDFIAETSGDGVAVDTVRSTVNWTLADLVEDLILVGPNAIMGIGNTQNNVITGNEIANILDGSLGADTMLGGMGNDIYYVDNLSDQIIELSGGGTDTIYSYLSSYLLGAEVENGRILSDGAANLTGNGLNNTLFSGGGDNVLAGGSGSDTVSYGYAWGSVSANLNLSTQQERSGSGADTLISIENITGSSFNDVLTGNSGANVLNGAGGADRMTGNDGSDVYYVDHAGDVVMETNANAATGGTDLVYSYLGSYTLGANIENGRILAAGVANLTGNSLNNTLTSGVGSNVLNGGAGTDTASYSAMTSAVTVKLALTGAQATGGSGSDTLVSIENLTGSSFNDNLTGNAAANRIDGGAGNDVLNGGLGNDTLIGGAGFDYFIFNTAPGAANVDIISGFSAVDDRIHLENTGIFSAFSYTGAMAAGAFNTGTAATQADDRIIYNSATGGLIYDPDGTGAAAAVHFATLSGLVGTLSAADFFII